MYGKLFASLYQGTLRGKSDEILVFTNLIAHADKEGIVDKHWRAISEEVGLSLEAVKAALLNLESPDPESRSPEMEGCRLIRLDEHRAWGWQIVNYSKYRAIRREDDRREQNRLAQARWRNRNKPPSASVSHGKQESAQAEAEAEVKAEARKREASPANGSCLIPEDWKPGKPILDRLKMNGLPEPTPEIVIAFRAHYLASGKVMRLSAWDSQFEKWCAQQRVYDAGRQPEKKYDKPMEIPE